MIIYYLTLRELQESRNTKKRENKQTHTHRQDKAKKSETNLSALLL